MHHFPPYCGPLTEQELTYLKVCSVDPETLDPIELDALKRAVASPRATPFCILTHYVAELELVKVRAMEQAFRLSLRRGKVFSVSPAALPQILGITLMERLAAACDRAPIIHGGFSAN